MLFFPEFAPPTVEDLPKDVDETGGLAAREKAASDKVNMGFWVQEDFEQQQGQSSRKETMLEWGFVRTFHAQVAKAFNLELCGDQLCVLMHCLVGEWV